LLMMPKMKNVRMPMSEAMMIPPHSGA
jgi:hypothetical protein